MKYFPALTLFALLACAQPPSVTPAAASPAAASHATPSAATITLATFRGDYRDGTLTLTRVEPDGRVSQALILANRPTAASGVTGTTTAPTDTVLLHQTAVRGVDGTCNSAPYGDPGVPAMFQGVCFNIQAISGYASSEVIRTYVELTSLTAGVTTPATSPDDGDFGVYDTFGLWNFGRLAATGTAGGLDRRALNWYFATPTPGSTATFSFIAQVKGEVVNPVVRLTPTVGMTGCSVSSTSRSAISRDGRYVAFVTLQNGCFGAAGGATQVMRLDRQTGALDVVSHGTGGVGVGSNGNNDQPSINGTGQFVAWRSTSTNLLPAGADAYGCTDGNGSTASIFVRNLDDDSIYVVDIDLNTLSTVTGFSAQRPAISDEGGFVAFETAAPLDLFGGDPNTLVDVYARDVFGGFVFIASLDGGARTLPATNASISTYASVVTFQSADPSFVAGDTGQTDVFAWESSSGGAVRRVSVTSAGAQANGDSVNGFVSADGYTVAFQSVATNLVGSATTAGRSHVYTNDGATIVRLDGRALTSGTEANGNATAPQVDYTGRMAVFVSTATNLDPFVVTNGIQAYTQDVRSVDPARLHARMVSATPADAPSGGGVASGNVWIATDANYAMFSTINSGNLVGDTLVGNYLYVAPLR